MLNSIVIGDRICRIRFLFHPDPVGIITRPLPKIASLGMARRFGWPAGISLPHKHRPASSRGHWHRPAHLVGIDLPHLVGIDLPHLVGIDLPHLLGIDLAHLVGIDLPRRRTGLGQAVGILDLEWIPI